MSLLFRGGEKAKMLVFCREKTNNTKKGRELEMTAERASFRLEQGELRHNEVLSRPAAPVG